MNTMLFRVPHAERFLDVERLRKRNIQQHRPPQRRQRRSRKATGLPATGQRWIFEAQATVYLGYPEGSDALRGLVRHGYLVEGEHFYCPTGRGRTWDRNALDRWVTQRRQPVAQQQPAMSEDELREMLAAEAKRAVRRIA